MSVQETISGVMNALWWIMIGATISLLYRFHIASKNPEKVIVEKICVTANGDEYCKSWK